LCPIYYNDAKDGDLIQALVYMDAKDLRFAEADGNRKANFGIVAMTFGDNGVPVNRISKNHTIQVNEQVYQRTVANGFVYMLPVPIKIQARINSASLCAIRIRIKSARLRNSTNCRTLKKDVNLEFSSG